MLSVEQAYILIYAVQLLEEISTERYNAYEQDIEEQLIRSVQEYYKIGKLVSLI